MSKAYTLKDIYVYFKEKHPDVEIEEPLFKEICEIFNKMIFEYIREGGVFNMGHNLSTLSIVRKKRNMRRKTVNFAETKKLKEQGIDAVVYFTDKYYVTHYWKKNSCKLKNKSVFRFRATRGEVGNKTLLVKKVQEHPLAMLKYPIYDP